MSDHHSLNIGAARASVGVAVVLIALKLLALINTQSLSVAASLVDSALDLVMSLAAIFAISYANRPPDEDHAFGHNSAEDLVALLQSAILMASAGGLLFTAWSRYIEENHAGLNAEGLGIAVMAASMALTLALVLWQGHVANKTGNKVIAADRLHYLADLLPAAGSIVALLASKYWGIWQLDAIVAAVAALVLIKGALEIGRGAWHALMDRAAEPELIDGIGKIAATWPGVLGWHDLKTRTSGSRVFAHLHIELDGNLRLTEAHAIGASLRRAIREAYPQVDIIIHKDVAKAH